jgi:hypothetical protein
VLLGNHLGNAGTESLARAVGWGRLGVLDLSCNDVGDRGIEALAASPILTNVRELDLGSHHMIGDNVFGDRGALALAYSPHLEQIAELRLQEMGGRISAAGWQALRQRFDARLQE